MSWPKRIYTFPADSEYLAKWMTKIKIDVNGCWVWQGFTHKKGYGETCYRGKNMRSHRAMYQLHKGPIPHGLLVCHTCDNPPCCNPDHLWLGTIYTNGQDAKQKKRCKYQKVTACKHGHPFTPENTYMTKTGWRQCKVCIRAKCRRQLGWPEHLVYAPPGLKVHPKWGDACTQSNRPSVEGK